MNVLGGATIIIIKNMWKKKSGMTCKGIKFNNVIRHSKWILNTSMYRNNKACKNHIEYDILLHRMSIKQFPFNTCGIKFTNECMFF